MYVWSNKIIIDKIVFRLLLEDGNNVLNAYNEMMSTTKIAQF